MATKRVGLWLRGIPRSLKEALIREAEARNTSMNDVAVQVLSDYLDFSFTPTGVRRTSPRPDALNIILNVKPELRQEIKARAVQQETNARDLTVHVLCDHFGVGFERAPSRPIEKPRKRRFLVR